MKRKQMLLTAAVAAVCLLCSCAQSAPPAEETDVVGQIADIATTQYFTDEAVKDSDIETIVAAGINAPSAMNGQPWHFSVITDAAVLQQISEDMKGGMGFDGKMPPMGGTMPEGMELPDGTEMKRPEGGAEGARPEAPNFAAGSDQQPPEGFAPPQGGDGMTFPPAGAPGGSGGAAKAGLTDAPLAIVVSCADGSELDAGLACQNMSATAQLLGYGTKIISSPTMVLNGEKQADYRQLLGIPENQSAAAILLIGKEDTSVNESMDGYTGATARKPSDELVTYVKG